MYFAILWNHTTIAQEELQLCNPTVHKKEWSLIFFDTEQPDTLNQLWWIIKRGKCVTEQELLPILQSTKILWVQDNKLGMQRKKDFPIKRFKQTARNHTDKDVQNKWNEIITFPQEVEGYTYGHVQGYQPIYLYEVIDFQKPWRSMQMGMMPAKLATMMINIWLNHSPDRSTNDRLYDPFCGSWTTLFLANNKWINALGSDIDTQYVEKNIDRRQYKKALATPAKYEYINHDSTKPLTTDKNIKLIVSEWRLWPIITEQSSPQKILDAQEEVNTLYTAFLQATHTAFLQATIVITIPHYSWVLNTIAPQQETLGKSLWYDVYTIPEVYKRPKQQVWRQICIFTPKK